MTSSRIDPFQILSLPRRFAFDRSTSESRYVELSKTFHPDRYAAASATERRLALSHAIEVNEAWRIVRDPIRRAEILLQLEGLENEIGETNEPKPDAHFLMDILELREQLFEIQSTKDYKAALQIAEQARKQQVLLEEKIAMQIDAALCDSEKKKELLRQTIPVLGQLRYVSRFVQESTALVEALEDSSTTPLSSTLS